MSTSSKRRMEYAMILTKLEKVSLVLSGLTAIGIGGMITFAPHAFYASYGITIGEDPSLLSELRAPGAGLATLGLMMLLGIWRSTLAQLAVAAALIVFLAFPAGRFIGLVADGMPSGGIISALVLEIAIAALCLFAFRKRLVSHPMQS